MTWPPTTRGRKPPRWSTTGSFRLRRATEPDEPADKYRGCGRLCLRLHGPALSRFSENATTGGVTGIQNNTSRWYDAVTGRWLSEDPIRYAAGDSNLFRYCRNRPVDGMDPGGEFLQIAIGAAVAAAWWFFTPNPANAPAPGDHLYPADPFPNPVPALVAGTLAGTGAAVLDLSYLYAYEVVQR